MEKKKNDDIVTGFVISITFILFTLLLIWLVSKILKKLVLNITNYKEYMKLVDENIIISTANLKGEITYASKAFCQISGYTYDELIGNSHNLVRHPDEDAKKYEQLWKKLTNNETWEGEFKNINKSGKTYWVKAKVYPVFCNGVKTAYTAIRQNITDKKIIEKLSITDGLTKVYNRTHFIDIMPKVLNSMRREDKYITFLMIDIDFFKQYNDTYGHKKGDEALKTLASTLKNSLKRGSDFIFRIGGEEFAIVILGESYERSLSFTKTLQKKVEQLKIIHEKNKASRYLTISLGMITTKAKKIKNYEELYNEADKLLYEAKKDNRNTVKAREI